MVDVDRFGDSLNWMHLSADRGNREMTSTITLSFPHLSLNLHVVLYVPNP